MSATCIRCDREMAPGATCIDTAPRIPWDGESNCGDCSTGPGGLHHAFCDMETCPDCGDQAIACGCIYPVIPVSA
jgi:hypothetical protein